MSSVRAPAGLRLDYLPRAAYQAAGWTDVLGVATFDSVPPGETGAADLPVAQVRTAVLGGEADLCEVWRCGGPVKSGQHKRVRLRRSDELLFGCIAVAEAPVPGTPRSTLHAATTLAYDELCATLEALRYPHLLRVWNYLPDINRDADGTERYLQFNTARQQALRSRGRVLRGNVPAASALGAASGSPVVVYFLAGKTAPVFVENPRQVSAYHYPRQYGPDSPVFSRAALVPSGDNLALFISGTASIVGHRSTHVGDTAAQTRETLRNIDALLREANAAAHGTHFDLGSLTGKVYVRTPADLPVIQRELAPALAAGARFIYLQADICRQDLAVEIEAAAIRPAAPAP
ncbi:MAG: pteridine-dependent deoxygenase [Steroidobacteraceae bacterium]